MSQKLPIGDVLNESVQFGLHRWGAALRFGWLPTVVSVLIVVAFFVGVFGPAIFTAHGEEAELEAFRQGLRVAIPVAVLIGAAAYLFIVFLFCGVTASMYRLAALGEERPGIFHLRTDGPAARVFFANMILLALNLAIWAVAYSIALAVNGESWGALIKAFMEFIRLAQAAETGKATDMEVAQALVPSFKTFFTAGLLAVVPLIYVNVKLAPFPAGTAAENRLLLFGSFSMTFGHFWSVFAIFVLLFLFLIAISIGFQLAVGTLKLIAALFAGQGGVLAVISGIIGLAVAVAGIFFQLFTFTLQSGVQAIIYRRLKTGE